MHIEWDDDKNLQSIALHGLSFEDAAGFFEASPWICWMTALTMANCEKSVLV